MKAKKIFIIIIVSLLLVGCTSSYQDVDKVMFLTSLMIDVDEEDNILLYMEIFHTYRDKHQNAETGVRLVFDGKGKTFLEAKQDLNEKAVFEINGTKNMAIAFTEKAAKKGINEYLNILVNDQNTLLKPYLIVYRGGTKEVINLETNRDDFLGIYIQNLFQEGVTIETKNGKQLYQYMNQRAFGENVDVIPIVNIEDDPKMNFEVDAGAVFKDDKMVSELTNCELRTYNILRGKSAEGIISIEDKNNEGSYIAFRVISNDADFSVEYDNKPDSTVNYKVNLYFELVFGETQRDVNLMDENVRNELISTFKEKVTKDCNNLFERFKKEKIDIFEVQEEFMRKYPNEKIDNVIEISKLDLNINVKFTGSSMTNKSNLDN